MGLVTGTALAISAIGTGASFVQAGKQNKLAKSAQAAADEAFKKAEAQLDVNYFEQLGISKTPYENQRDAIAQAGAQAMEIAKESERGGAATAGRVLAQSNIAQQNITDKQTKDLEALNKLVATEESKLGTARANLSLSQAEGAGIAAAQAENLSNQAVTQGIQGLGNMAMIGLQGSELYKQDKAGGAAGLAGDTNTAVTLDATPSFTPTNQAQLIRPNEFQGPMNQLYPQVVPSQNMPNPVGAFMQAGVNGSGLTQEQYLNLINPLR